MTSASPTSLSTTNESELTNANTQGNKDISMIGGTEQHSGGDDLDAAKKLNLFYDEE